jgi:hypothetical protein
MAFEGRKMKVVIVGGVATGPKAAARLRRLNPKTVKFMDGGTEAWPYESTGGTPKNE